MVVIHSTLMCHVWDPDVIWTSISLYDKNLITDDHHAQLTSNEFIFLRIIANSIGIVKVHNV